MIFRLTVSQSISVPFSAWKKIHEFVTFNPRFYMKCRFNYFCINPNSKNASGIKMNYCTVIIESTQVSISPQLMQQHSTV